MDQSAQARWDNYRTLFDADWYARAYREAVTSADDLLDHYMTIGWTEGFEPNPFFDGMWYLSQNPDVEAAGMNPLLHYQDFGRHEDRWPSPRFDPHFYAHCYLDDADTARAFEHYLLEGQQQGLRTQLDILQTAWDGDRHKVSDLHQIWYLARFPDRKISIETKLVSLEDHTIAENLERYEHSALNEIEGEWTKNGSYPGNVIFTRLLNCVVMPGLATIFPAPGKAIAEEIRRIEGNASEHSLVKCEEQVAVSGLHLKTNCSINLAPAVKAGIHMFKEYDSDYAYFILELLTKINLIETEFEIPTSVPILVCDDLPDNVYAAIDQCKHSERSVLRLKREVPYRVDKLYYCSDITQILDTDHREAKDEDTFLPTSAVQQLSRKIRDGSKASSAAGRKIYLKRSCRRGEVTNEAVIIDALIDRGFEILDLDGLSFQAQVDIFKGAATVVGSSGAVFANLLWCEKGTEVVVLYPNHPRINTSLWSRIARINGLKLKVLTGRRAGKLKGIASVHDDYTIRADQLVSEISR